MLQSCGTSSLRQALSSKLNFVGASQIAPLKAPVGVEGFDHARTVCRRGRRLAIRWNERSRQGA